MQDRFILTDKNILEKNVINITDIKKNNSINLIEYIEKNQIRLRNKLINVINSYRKNIIFNKTIYDYLKFNEDFSFWYFTALSHKYSFEQNSGFDNCIKLFAIEEIIKEYNIKHVVIDVKDNNLTLSLINFFKKKNINFLNQNKFHFINIFNKITVFLQINLFFKAIIKIILLLKNIKLIKSKNNITSDLMLFDIFVHFDKDKISKGVFESFYWSELTNILKKRKINYSYFHNFFKFWKVKKLRNAENLIKISNQADSHFFFDQYFYISVYFKGISLYFKILFKSIFLLFSNKTFNSSLTDINLKYLLIYSFTKSLIGTEAVNNSINYFKYEKALQNLPYQKLGFYICENQTWEMILNKFWKKYNHGKLIGILHTTLRFWDLRYVYCKEIYDLQKNSNLLPNYFAINGEEQKKITKLNNILNNQILEIEALRYSHLIQYPKKRNLNNKVKKFLIIGDFVEKTNIEIIKLINFSKEILLNKFDVFFKPHPAYLFENNFNKFLNVIIIDKPIKNLIDEFDIILCSHATSTIVDFYYSGSQVILYKNINHINYSCVNDFKDINIVSNYKQFIKIINENYIHSNKKNPRDFFYLDNKYSKLNKILDNYC
ncbi:MAG: hypothetical protein CMI96_04045 [Pelagibacteraceae bacterium]|nr:hypothetical protein [Pelagibacteraceae bacterium]